MRFPKVLFFCILPIGLLLILIEGLSQLYWLYLEREDFNTIAATGEIVLRNDAINYWPQRDEVVGYRIRTKVPHSSNRQGFAQVEIFANNQAPESLRKRSKGESTTLDANLRTNCPSFLLQIPSTYSRHHQNHQAVLNADVSSWIQDQGTAFTQSQVGDSAPDVVIIYGGWDDIHYYDSLNGIPNAPLFKSPYDIIPTAWSYLKSVTLGGAILKNIMTGHGFATTQVLPKNPSGEKKYHFLLKHMSQTVQSFRNISPNIKIVISSLVGRWPMDTEAPLRDKFGSVGGMGKNWVGRHQAAIVLTSFNDYLKRFAKENDLVFVDMARAFENLDRQRLMVDYCHMTADGYRIMASTFYRELHRLKIVRGKMNGDYDSLIRQFTIKDYQRFSKNTY